MNKDKLLPKKKCLQFEFDQVNFPLKNVMNNLQRTIESHYITFYNVQDTIQNCSVYEESVKCEPFSRDKTINQDQFQNDLDVRISRHEF